ncbi:PREDICTED: F-box protein At4g00755-like [Lupinus angustifolius]|uniref:F-box protein At4g00755-like n=1 Tax=Lupinus angustifolius TaxID=3871 RepID=UPI00092F5CF2|nr:PREDICTED: F-box protein At4g00755-like [Lupinus angustifolius]
MSSMEYCIDFLSCLDADTCIKILKSLDDPADLVRLSCVSQSSRHYVISNGLCKQLCLRMFPQLSRVSHVVELNEHEAKEQTEVGSSYSMEWLGLVREHRIYSYLARASTSSVDMNCIAKTLGASSTDNFPQESIDNTLEPRDTIAGRFFYWSSSGQSNPNVPETLTYELISQICVISEINIQPFQADFQLGSPIYSAKSVRFKMGHPITSLDPSADEKFVWTYTSPEFPMAQENRLQKFKLPEPVLCIGGILQIELLGRVQRQEMDDLFYICISYVQIVGCSLSPAYSVEILEPSGRFVLKSDQLARCQPLLPSEEESGAISTDHMPVGLRDFPHIVNILQEHVIGVVEHDWDEYEVDDFEEEYAV